MMMNDHLWKALNFLLSIRKPICLVDIIIPLLVLKLTITHDLFIGESNGLLELPRILPMLLTLEIIICYFDCWTRTLDKQLYSYLCIS